MADFDALKKLLILKLYDWADSLDSPREISGDQIVGLLSDQTGAAIATQVYAELLNEGLLCQTSAAEDEHEGYYEVTPQPIRSAQGMRRSESSEGGLLKFTEFRDNLIVALYKKSNEHGLELYLLKELADENKIPYREGWIIEFCNFLHEHAYALVRRVFGDDKIQAAQLNASGLEYAEELMEQSIHRMPPDAFNAIPASDRYVEIDHNDPEFKDVETKLEKAIESIRGLNAPTKYDQEQVVRELSLGQRLFKSTKVRVGAVVAMILTPLYTVYQDVAAEMLRPALIDVISAIRNLPGL